MAEQRFILTERRGAVAILTLNRPEVLNAWHRPMREALVAAMQAAEAGEEVGALVLTGAGSRAFCAGQDLNEAKDFDADRAEEWIGEWRVLYDTLRSLSKPVVIALNGLAAGSGFQFALLGDFRIGHAGVTMGQPEINSGVASTTGPWIMREMLGLARTIDLTLTGRMMGAEECHAIGLLNRIVAPDMVLAESLSLAEELAAKPRLVMKLNKARFREMTQPGFEDCLRAGVRNQRIAYGSGESGRVMGAFLAGRAARKGT